MRPHKIAVGQIARRTWNTAVEMHTRAANMDRHGPTDILRERTARRSIRESHGSPLVAGGPIQKNQKSGTIDRIFRKRRRDRGARWDRGVETKRSSEAP